MSDQQITANDLGVPRLKDLMNKNFWQRPEGTAGKIVLAIMAAAALFGLVSVAPAILAYILFIAQTGTQIVLHAAFLGAVYLLLTSKAVKMMAAVAFKGTIRKLLKGFIDLSPVAFTRYLIDQAFKRLEGASEAIKNFKVSMNTTHSKIATMQAELSKKEDGAKNYARKNKKEQAQLLLEGAERLRASVGRLTKLYQKMEVLSRTAEQMQAKAILKVQGEKEKLELQITEFEASLEMGRAISSLKRAVRPSVEEQEAFDMGVATMALEVAETVVEVDEFLKLGEEIFSSIDLDQAVYSERAIAQLDKWEKDSQQSKVLGPGEKRSLIETAYNPAVPYDVNVPVQTPTTNEIRKSFNPDDFFSS